MEMMKVMLEKCLVRYSTSKAKTGCDSWALNSPRGKIHMDSIKKNASTEAKLHNNGK
jgi:hypothetical protein